MGVLNSWKPAFSNYTAYKVERRVWLNDSQELTKICGSSVNTLGSRHRSAALSLHKVPLSAQISQKLQKSSCFWPRSPRQIPQSTGNPPGQVLPIFLPLEPHSYSHGTLEEVTLELQSNFPMLAGSQKHTLFFFLDCWLQKGTSCAKPWLPWTRGLL